MSLNAHTAEVAEAASLAYGVGICIVPPVEDGSKRPQDVGGSWNQFKTERPKPELMKRWYPGRSGLGNISNPETAECVDFDCRQTYLAFVDAAQRSGLGELVARVEAGYCDDTPGGGVRYLWKAPGAKRDSNQKIARRPKRPEEKRDEHDKVKVLIELPDYAILAPTNGKVHPSGRPYVRRSGNFDTIATIAVDERDAILDLMRSFDEMPVREAYVPPKTQKQTDGLRPGDDFSTRNSWADVLEPFGWTHVFTRGEASYWRRPGRNFGWSASTNFAGGDCLVVFSTSTDFEPFKSYTKFGAYAVLKHGGDFSAAAKALWADGYGEPSTANDSTTAPRSEAASEKVSLDDFYSYMVTHNYIFVPSREPWPASSVNSRIPPIVVGQDEDGEDIALKASSWLDKNRPVEQMTWAPGEPMVIDDRLVSDGGWIVRPGCRVFNLYRPPRWTEGDPSAGGSMKWLDHVATLYHENVHHILRWLAHRVQRPHEKINHALVLGGLQGIGKDTLLEPVKYAVGPWNFIEVSPAHLMGRFNGFVKSVILRVSEARDLGEMNRFTFYDHMKVFTAAPPDVLRVDEKNLREYSVFNVCGVIITTNHKTDGIYLPADDRRHFVAWSDLTKEDFSEAYWKELYAWYAAGGLENVAAYLRSFDISDFNPKAPPPQTPAFREIVEAGQSPEDAELATVLDFLGTPEAVTLGEIVRKADKGFAEWLTDRRNCRAIPHRLEDAGYVRVSNPDDRSKGLWRVDGKRQAVYARKELSQRDRVEAARGLR